MSARELGNPLGNQLAKSRGAGINAGGIGSIAYSYTKPGENYIKGGVFDRAEYPRLASLLGNIQDVAPVSFSTVTATNLPTTTLGAKISEGADGVLIGLTTGVIRRSTDGGLNWVNVTPAGMEGAATPRCLAAGRDGVVCAFFYISGIGTKMWRSADNGQTFSRVNNTSDFGYPEAVDVGANGTWITSGGSGSIRIFRSTDNGLTWANVGPTNGTTGYMTIRTDGFGTWVTGGIPGSRISFDDGASWSVLPISAKPFQIDTDGDGTWVVLSYASASEPALCFSTDNAVSWTVLPNAALNNLFYGSGSGIPYGLANDRRGNWIIIYSQDSTYKARKNTKGLTEWSSIANNLGITALGYKGDILLFGAGANYQRGVIVPSYNPATQFYVPPLGPGAWLRAR